MVIVHPLCILYGKPITLKSELCDIKSSSDIFSTENLFRQRELLPRIEPLLKNDFAVFGFADVHRAGVLLQIICHLLAHVDSDSLRAFAN